jgi:hypothetical protein
MAVMVPMRLAEKIMRLLDKFTPDLSPSRSHCSRLRMMLLLTCKKEDNAFIEPEWYIPVILTVLIDGTGARTGKNAIIPGIVVIVCS